MSKLTEAILPQNFELVRDRIADILTIELAAQKVLQPTERALKKFELFTERSTPFDKSEDTIISVMFTSDDFENQDIQSVYGSVMYSIDCYSAAKSNENKNGSSVSRIKVGRILGIIRSILSAPAYYKLDFTENIIVHRSVKTIQMSDDDNNKDSFSVSMGRLSMLVKMAEDTEALTPQELNLYRTSVKIGDTDKGLLYEVIKP